MSSNLGIDGTASVDPLTFIVTLAGFIPAGFQILQGLCYLFGMVMLANAFLSQIDTARGRGDKTLGNNLLLAFWGGVIAVTAELIGAYGKGIFSTEFESASVLLYVAKGEGNLAKTAVAAFLFLVQLIGACAVVVGIRLSSRLSTGRGRPDESWTGVFFYTFGGVVLVFIQPAIGIFSAMTGLGIARFINTL